MAGEYSTAFFRASTAAVRLPLSFWSTPVWKCAWWKSRLIAVARRMESRARSVSPSWMRLMPLRNRALTWSGFSLRQLSKLVTASV